MKKIIAGLMAFTLMMGSIILPETATQILSDISIVANAATDAWGREYLTYGDLRYQVLSDNTVSIIGFDVSKDTVEIPDEIDGMPVTKIGNYAFYNASYIVTVDIPDTVTYIGTKSFYKCKSLQIVTIPEGVTIIANEAFRYCSALTSIDLPNTVEKIGDYAFSESGLVEMVLPESVETLSYRAFYSCNSLTTFKFPTEITTLGIGIFSYSKALESVTLPTNITSIPDKMFYHCEGLKNITIPDSVETIGDSSFCDCVSLEKIVIPSSVKTIKESAFEACTSLKSANLPEGVTSLGKYVFLDCVSLTDIVFPRTITSAGDNCFFGCNSITVYVYSDSYGFEYVLRQASLGNTIPFKILMIADVTGLNTTSTTANTTKLTWNKVDDAKGYVVYRYDDAQQDWVKIAKSTANSTYYNVSKLTPGTTYKFAVKAYKDSNGYELLSQQYASVSVTTLLPTVTGLKTTTNTSSSISMNWDKIDGATGYVVYQAINGKWERIKVTSGNSLTVSNLKAGTNYKFTVRAYKTVNGTNYYSQSYTGVWMTTLPSKPTAEMTVNTAQAIRLEWDKVTGATGYVVYKQVNGTWQRVTVTKSNVYVFTGLSSGTNYNYAVRAYKTLNGKNYYSAFATSTDTVKACTKPAAVNFKLTAGSKKATVSWSKVNGATGYIVYYKTSANGSWQRLTTTTGTSYTKTGLTSGKTYYFTVKAYKTYNGKTYSGSFTAKSIKIK